MTIKGVKVDANWFLGQLVVLMPLAPRESRVSGIRAQTETAEQDDPPRSRSDGRERTSLRLQAEEYPLGKLWPTSPKALRVGN